MSVYVMAWIASVAYGLETAAMKLVSKHSISNPWLFNFFWTLSILVFTAIVAAIEGSHVPLFWENIILGSAFYALGSIFFVLAIYDIDVSVIGPLFSFRTAMAVMLGSVFLKETLTANQYLAIGVIFLFGIFVSFDEQFTLKSFFNRRVAAAFLGMLFLALMAMFIKKAVAETGFWTATLWIAMLAQIWMSSTIPLLIKDIRSLTGRQILSVSAIAVIGTVGTLAANAAYAKSISIAAAIISLPLSMIIAFAASLLAPKLLESHAMKLYAVRFVSAAIMFMAAMNL